MGSRKGRCGRGGRAWAALWAAALSAGALVVPAGAAGRAAPSCFGLAPTITGTAGPDTLPGTAGPDVIAGWGGDDTIYGFGGNDRLCGGSGDDTVVGGAGADRIGGDGGADVIRAGPGTDTLWGGDGADDLRGGYGDDVLEGGTGVDALRGEAGTDRARGGPGVDTCYGEHTAACELPAPPPVPVASARYVSPSGDDANPGTRAAPWRTIQHAADRLVAGQTVYIRGGTYSERVQARRSGTADAGISFVAYLGEVPVIDGTGVTLPAGQAGLFEINGFDYVRVSGLRLVNAGPDENSNGILVHRAWGVVLENNETYNTRSSGIGVWSSGDVVVRGNEIVRACTGRYQESLTVAGTVGFEVEGNIVHGTGGGKEGIGAKDGARDGAIHGNLVYDIPAVGIYVDAWDKPTSGIAVYANTVHHTGSIGIAVASEMGGLLQDVAVYDNLVHHSTCLGIVVTRNGASPGHPMQGITIVNNTVWRNGAMGCGDPPAVWGGGIAVDNPDAGGVVVRNNIISANLSFQLARAADVPVASAAIDHNLIHGYRGDLEDGEIYGAAHVEGKPRFRDAPGGDFHVRAGSPAVDAGRAAGAPATDFDGVARPVGAGFDIGAYER